MLQNTRCDGKNHAGHCRIPAEMKMYFTVLLLLLSFQQKEKESVSNFCQIPFPLTTKSKHQF